MENSIKAMYIVIGVVLGLLILTLFAYTFSNGGKFLSSFTDSGNTKQIEQYNAELAIYDKENNTIYDVISACNLAYDINKQNDYDNVNKLEIEIEIDSETYKLENNKDLLSGKIKKGNNEESIIELINKEIDGNKLSALVNETTANSTHEERNYVHTFTGEVSYNNQTGKINLITFVLNN